MSAPDEGEELREEPQPLSAERRTLTFLALTSALSGLAECFPDGEWDLGSIAGLPYLQTPLLGMGVHVVGIGLMLLLAFRMKIRAYGTLALLLVGSAMSIRALPLAFEVDQSVKVVWGIGHLGLFGTTVALVVGHLPRHRIALAILVGSAGYVLARLTPYAGLYTFIPRLEAGLLVSGLGFLASIFLFFQIPDPAVTAEATAARRTVPRLRLLIFGMEILMAMLFPLVIRVQPTYLFDGSRDGNLVDFASDLLPLIILPALFLWRIPDRLGAALRIATGSLILVLALAWFVPAVRIPINYAGWSIGAVGTSLATYIAACAVRTQLRLPVVVGLGTIGWGVQIFFFQGYRLPERVIGGILAGAAIFLIVLLVLPTAERNGDPALTSNA